MPDNPRPTNDSPEDAHTDHATVRLSHEKMAETNLGRREVLRKAGVASGGLLMGSAAMSGPGVAKRGGTGFIGSSWNLERGDTFTVVAEVETLTVISVECEGNNRNRDIYTRYIIQLESASVNFWVKGQGTLDIGSEFRIERVRDCGQMKFEELEEFEGFLADKITFRPENPE